MSVCNRRTHKPVFILYFLLFIPFAAQSVSLKDINKADQGGLNASKSAQMSIAAIDEQIQQKQAEYTQINRETRIAKKYQQQLESQISQLEQALATLNKQRGTLRQTRTHLAPLMDEMFVTLEQLIYADSPFLIEERALRLQQLKVTLSNPTLSLAEKMTRLLDAYQVELSYGYSVSSYQGQLENQQLVTFLRVGRLGFYYLTQDGESFRWLPEKGWQALDSHWTESLEKAVATATGESIPALMTLPDSGAR